jgi:hypothetical protein
VQPALRRVGLALGAMPIATRVVRHLVDAAALESPGSGPWFRAWHGQGAAGLLVYFSYACRSRWPWCVGASVFRTVQASCSARRSVQSSSRSPRQRVIRVPHRAESAHVSPFKEDLTLNSRQLPTHRSRSRLNEPAAPQTAVGLVRPVSTPHHPRICPVWPCPKGLRC